jgi:hypothetical protein
METKKTSKLRRYKIFFVISLVGFMLTMLFVNLYFKSSIHNPSVQVFGLVLGMMTGTSLFGIIIFGGLALSESNKEGTKATLVLKRYKLLGKISAWGICISLLVGSFINIVLNMNKLGHLIGYLAIFFFALGIISIAGIGYGSNDSKS